MQSLDDVTLERWLRAENFNVDRAEKRLRAHAIWRKEEFPEGRVLEASRSAHHISSCLLPRYVEVFRHMMHCILHSCRLRILPINIQVLKYLLVLQC